MDILELESSNGQLNKFMYGFEPTESQNEENWLIQMETFSSKKEMKFL